MINTSIDREGIATLEWDLPGTSQNIIDEASIEAFDEALDRVLANPATQAVLVASAKKSFIAGADLRMVLKRSESGGAMQRTRRWQLLLRRLETCGKPVAAALSGTALGGGLALALACHYRVAAERPGAVLGFPEVAFGLLPSGGSAQRLARTLGVEAAVQLMMQGTRLAPAKALRAGLVDAVAPSGEERAVARAWLLAQASGGKGPTAFQQPWDRPGFQPPAGADWAALRAQAPHAQPAAQQLLMCIEEGLATSFDNALALEAQRFAALVVGSDAKNRIRTLFFAMNDANRLGARPEGIPTRRYQRIGVLGSGMMGSGIAYAAANAGIEVVLIDVDAAAAARGKEYSRKLLTGLVDKGRIKPEAMQAVLDRITTSADFSALTGCTLVVEAVFEDRAVKADVTRRAEAVLPADAVFATNTSTLPITGLAQASGRPAQFIGLHFFSPAERMPLVEVIRGEQTSDTTLAHALDFIQALGKTPVVVHDGRGFYTSRVLRAYLAEAAALIEEGVDPALIEKAAQSLGMPIGPLTLIDDVSLDLMVKFARQDQADLGEAYVPTAIDRVATRLVVDLGRTGRKGGKGFYDYPAGGKKQLWAGLAEHYPRRDPQPTVDAVAERLLLIQSVETARCMEEGVVRRPQDADVGAVLGWGYPSPRGGPVGWIHTMGVPEFVAACDRLAQQTGPRFQPTATLRSMAQRGEAFYNA